MNTPAEWAAQSCRPWCSRCEEALLATEQSCVGCGRFWDGEREATASEAIAYLQRVATACTASPLRGMNACFRLAGGWELRARTAPEALGRYGPALREITLWEPETSEPDRLRTGLSFAGDDWKACFRQLRQELDEGRWLSARLVPTAEAPSEPEGPLLVSPFSGGD